MARARQSSAPTQHQPRTRARINQWLTTLSVSHVDMSSQSKDPVNLSFSSEPRTTVSGQNLHVSDPVRQLLKPSLHCLHLSHHTQAHLNDPAKSSRQTLVMEFKSDSRSSSEHRTNCVTGRSKPVISESAENRVLFQDRRVIILLKRCAGDFQEFSYGFAPSKRRRRARRTIHIYYHCSIISLKSAVSPRQLGSRRATSFHTRPSNTCSIPQSIKMSSNIALATACSVSYDRLKIRPSASHNPHLTATPEPLDIHRTTQGGCGEHSNEKCNVHMGERLRDETY